MMSSRWAVCFCVSSLTCSILAANPSPAESIYVADPAMGMIYARDRVSGRAVPVSGAFTVSAAQVEPLSATKLLLVPVDEDVVVLLDTEANTVQKVWQARDGVVARGVSAGADQASFSVRTFDGFAVSIIEVRRRANGVWEETAYPVSRYVTDVVKTADDGVSTPTYLLADSYFNPDVPANLYRVQQFPEGITVHESPIPIANLLRGPQGEIVVEMGRGFPYNSQDSSLAILGNPGFTADDIPALANLPTAKWWGAEGPEIVAVKRGRLLVQPGGPGDPMQVLHDSFQEAGPRGGGRDTSGAISVSPREDGSFMVYDMMRERLEVFDPATKESEPQFVFRYGTGAPFENLNDIVFCNDELFALDANKRIVHVDLATGDRSLVHEFEDASLLEFIAADNDGRLVVVDHEFGNLRKVVIDPRVPNATPSAGAYFTSSRNIIAMSDRGDPYAVFPNISLNSFGRITEAGFSSGPLSNLPLENIVATQSGYRATVQVPANHEGTAQVAVIAMGPMDLYYLSSATFTAPDDTVLRMDWPSLMRAESPKGTTGKFFAVHTEERAAVAGEWDVELTFHNGSKPTELTSATLSLRPLNSPTALAEGPTTGVITLLTNHPPQLHLLNTATNQTIQISLTMDGSQPDYLNYINEIAYTADGQLLAAPSDRVDLLSVDTTTGAATSLGFHRPQEHEEVFGTGEFSHLRLAAGPDPRVRRPGWAYFGF